MWQGATTSAPRTASHPTSSLSWREAPEELGRMTSAARITRILIICLLAWQPAGTVLAQADLPTQPPAPTRYQITLTDGYSFEVDEVWKQGDEIWYRKGALSKGLDAKSVKKFGPLAANTPSVKSPSPDLAGARPATPTAPLAIWIYLNGGARLQVEEVNETT